MSQVFEEDGRMIPITYIQCEPNTVWQVKEKGKDGADAIVLGAQKLPESSKAKKFRTLRQISGKHEVKKGDELSVGIFEKSEKVTVVATSKGKGFQGNVKRHNFSVIRLTHGTKYPRHGSTGACAMPGRTKPGLKMPGRMGSDKITLRNRSIVRVDTERSLIAIKGPVPGSKNSLILIKKQS